MIFLSTWMKDLYRCSLRKFIQKQYLIFTICLKPSQTIPACLRRAYYIKCSLHHSLHRWYKTPPHHSKYPRYEIGDWRACETNHAPHNSSSSQGGIAGWKLAIHIIDSCAGHKLRILIWAVINCIPITKIMASRPCCYLLTSRSCFFGMWFWSMLRGCYVTFSRQIIL